MFDQHGMKQGSSFVYEKKELKTVLFPCSPTDVALAKEQ